MAEHVKKLLYLLGVEWRDRDPRDVSPISRQEDEPRYAHPLRGVTNISLPTHDDDYSHLIGSATSPS